MVPFSCFCREKKNVLSIYHAWMSTSESDCNPYHLATKNVNVRASGQKVGKERRNRKTQKNPEPSFTVTNQDQLLLAAMGTNQSAPNVSGSRTLEATNWQPTVGGHSPILSVPLESVCWFNKFLHTSQLQYEGNISIHESTSDAATRRVCWAIFAMA